MARKIVGLMVAGMTALAGQSGSAGETAACGDLGGGRIAQDRPAPLTFRETATTQRQ